MPVCWMLWIHTNVSIGIMHTCGHVSVICSSFCSSIRCFCLSVCLSVRLMSAYPCAHRFIFCPSIYLIFHPSVCLSVCMYACTCTYVETNVLVHVIWTSKNELTWLIPCLVWDFTGHSFHLFFFFVSRFKQWRFLHSLCKTVFTITKTSTNVCEQ